MANHSLESFSGGRYESEFRAANRYTAQNESAAERVENPAKRLVTKLGRYAAGWLRTNILNKRQETLSTPTTQPADLDANAYVPRHALTSEPAGDRVVYQAQRRRPLPRAVAVHNGERGLYRSTFAAESRQSPSEHMAEVIRLRDAIAVARTRNNHIIKPRRIFSMPADLDVPPVRLPQPTKIKPQDAFASFKETLPPPAADLGADAVVTDIYSRRRRRLDDREGQMAQAS